MRRACLILMLVALFAGAAFAGHAFDGPVATTNPGDFWVSGNMDCDGTSVWDGVATFNADAIFTLDLSVGVDLAVTGDVACDSLYVGSNMAVTDSLYVGNNATIADTLKVSGALKGALISFYAVRGAANASNDSDGFLPGGYSLSMAGGTERCIPMPCAGSIISITGQCNIDSYTPTASIAWDVKLDNVSEITDCTHTLAATGITTWTRSWVRGEHTFTANQGITLEFNVTGTLQYDYHQYLIVIQLDD